MVDLIKKYSYKFYAPQPANINHRRAKNKISPVNISSTFKASNSMTMSAGHPGIVTEEGNP